MDALILSCSTGGGHNAAGLAIKKELETRGHHVVMMDPYELVSHKLAVQVGNTYVKMVQRMPGLFGLLYSLGGLVRRIPGKSPVYYVNIAVAKKLQAYLSGHPVDVILMPHLFPAELVTYLKRSGEILPLTVFIATDYACIPFTEETDCEFYVVPGDAQVKDFTKRKIKKEYILPFGIPVNPEFDEKIDRQEARLLLDLVPGEFYVLLTGGSIGAGHITRTIRELMAWMNSKRPDGHVIVVCGNNERLYRKLKYSYGDKLILLKKTERMALYMKACDLFISKPGGLSSTEAAVVGVPYVQVSPIPGCESKNMRYFSKKGMSIGVKHPENGLRRAMDKLSDLDLAEQMLAKQKKGVPANARIKICDWLEQTVAGRQKCQK